MTSAVTSIAERTDSSDLHALMQNLGRAAVAAAERLALADSGVKNQALLAAAAAIRAQAASILAANAYDLRDGEAASMSGALLDRLSLDARRVEAMARGLEEVAALAGYGSAAAFIRAFRRAYDTTPARLRVTHNHGLIPSPS